MFAKFVFVKQGKNIITCYSSLIIIEYLCILEIKNLDVWKFQTR